MNQLAGGLARVSGGYELGLFGMEGRGVYASASVAGATAGMSQNGGFSYGFEEQVYIGSGNNSLDVNGKKIGNMVGFELWLPTLGKYGHFALGQRYDVSEEGIANVQREMIRMELGEDFLIAYEKEKNLAKKAAMLNDAMLAAGFVEVDHLNNFHEGVKTTYAKGSFLGKFWGNYGNIEIITEYSQSGKPTSMYSSYNYGNHWWTHVLLDVGGYYGQKY